MERKNLIIIVFFLSGIFLVLLFLNFNSSWKNQEARINESNWTDKSNRTNRTDKSNRIPKKISLGRVNLFDLNSRLNKIFFYEESNSIIYEAELDGSGKKELTRIPEASEITFGPAGQNLIASVFENKTAKKIYFDLENNRRAELNPGIKNAAFSPDGKKLAYHFYDGRSVSDEGNISVSNPDGSDFKIILKTRIKNLKISWPEDDLIVFYSTTGENPPLFSISPQAGKLQKLPDQNLIQGLDEKTEGKEILKKLGIEASKTKLGPLEDYLIFIDSRDGKLYSLKL